VKILLVSHPPLAAELGAAQAAMNLAAALRERGHDALAWSPEPLPVGTRSWNLWLRQRQAVERFAAAEGPFDVIDTPAISAGPELARRGRLVVRSIQPELRYLAHGVRSGLRHSSSPRSLARALMAAPPAGAILRGWRRARVILCLGTHELVWMRQRFPFWSSKLRLHYNAIAEQERPALAEIRRRRRCTPAAAGTRFLWIGRWTGHKGIRRLIELMAARIAASPSDLFTVAGCGPLAARDVPADWLRSGRVALVPSFTRSELPALLAAHQSGLFTSDVEGWGLNLIEMLESGLTVFATEAGAVADLRPYFPASLRPFPPPAAIEPRPLEDLDATDYYRRFSWPGIASSYEREALSPCERTR
jgi:glycosyltransferase involved in cell wall biosynthesis